MVFRVCLRENQNFSVVRKETWQDAGAILDLGTIACGFKMKTTRRKVEVGQRFVGKAMASD
ncbi:hypothetical protein PI125_g10762 [Phytophthora idaei]|nr:hypothetical protein PI125_g10762 [Phytophthora idaei]